MHSSKRQLHLDPQALKHNLARVRSYASHSKILAMVKANAYGHGLIWAAQVLADAKVDALGVAVVEEGIALRDASFDGQIVLADGVQSLTEMEEARALGLTIVFHQAEQLNWLEKLKGGAPLSAWLKIDTGMHRLGFLPNEILAAYDRLSTCAFVKKPIVVMTHFSDADDVRKTKTREQIDLFNQVYKTLPDVPLTSLANSAGIVAWPDSHGDWVRPGLMLYGASPLENQMGLDFNLHPVMTVQSTLIAVHDYPAGSKLGYGELYTCPKNMRVGVVAFGYGDGYPRLIEHSSVWIDGHVVPIIARISMDMLQVDLTDLPAAYVGQSVTLWGEHHPVEIVARAAHTTAYEIFSHLQRSRLQTI